MRKFLGLVFFFCFYFFYPNSASAASENFIADYNATYQVLEDANTLVTFDVTLINKSSQFYASSYNIQVGFKNIDGVSAKDVNGLLNPKLTKNNDGNIITLNFTKPVVGLNNKNKFSVSFNTPDIAQKSKNIWDINIPGLAKQNEFRTFNVIVIVPSSLGEPSYIKPDVGNLKEGSFRFTKEELGDSGISISFGKEEVYKFKLSYHLENPTFFPIKKEIALPPSTNYQDIKIDKIEPPPINVVEDKDGNWLAQYLVRKATELEIKVEGTARISLHPKKEEVSQERLREYLKEQPYWQAKDTKIKELAKELKTPSAIYEYVSKTLKYDFSRVTSEKPRLGAVEVLKNPQSAVCLEFTDLFIALARAAGIPAREVNGFAYTKNSKERPLSLVKDILHSWPEYYDSDLKTWVMIDPTWGNTTGGVDYFYTLDFDHFAFVKKGTSTYPIPAGGYKFLNKKNTKDIEVAPIEIFSGEQQKLAISEEFSNEYLSFANISGNILVKNLGNIESSPQVIDVRSNFLDPRFLQINLEEIPPFGFLKIPLYFNRVNILTNTKDTIKISINENSISKDIRISPFVVNKWSIMGGIIIVSTFIVVSIIIAKSRHIPFFR